MTSLFTRTSKVSGSLRWLLVSIAMVLPSRHVQATEAAKRPNIIVILADDLGYGDVSCLNPKSKISTPHMDRLAQQGMTFTDAHSPSAVCTPTRYGLLTGRYAWRTRLKNGVLFGWSPPLIDVDRLTLPALLKRNGYATACIGKWHLGLGWQVKTGEKLANENDGWKYDYAKPFLHGPTTRGFDEFFGISASLDMPPFVYLHQDRATEVPTVEKTWVRKGPAGKDFEAIEVLPTLTRKAVDYIGRQATSAKKGEPFFLFLPLISPHTPVLPSKEWKGKSKAGDYGDFVVQTDDAVGQVLAALEKHGLANDTLVIVTSDNGAAHYVVQALEAMFGHFSSFHFRGYKADIWEGGHRVPFFARWPGHIQAGSTNDEVLCLVDLTATMAALVGDKLPKNAAEDSFNLLPAFLGEKRAGPLREATVLHSIQGMFGLRQGDWMLIQGQGSGGFGKKLPLDKAESPVQLYDMRKDIRQRDNVANANPDVVRRMEALLQRYKDDGASRR